jgi:hypothetical protein
MDNTALLFLVESVLGKGQSTSKGNYALSVPSVLITKTKWKLVYAQQKNVKISGIVGCVVLKVKHTIAI